MEDLLFDGIALVASITSLALAVIAIWLSFKFFKLSNETSEKANEASMRVMYSVKELEKLYGLLRTESFSIVRETVSDIRKYVWRKEPNEIDSELEIKTEERINALKNDLTGQLSTLLTKQNNAGNKINDLESALSSLLETAVTETKNIESKVKGETIRDYVIKSIKEIKKRNRRSIADLIIDMAIDDGLNPKNIVDELHKMKKDKYIHFEGERIENGAVEIVLLKDTD